MTTKDIFIKCQKALLVFSICFSVQLDGVSQIPGCTNQYACNFNPAATQDNGSCDFTGAQWYIPNNVAAANLPLVQSCSPVANYSLSPYQSCLQDLVNLDPYCVDTDWDNICVNEFNSMVGCTDPGACNYEPSAACDDGTCSNADQWYIPNNVAATNTPLILSCAPVANYTISPYQSCVQALVDMDPYCANTDWDNICVNEYNSMVGCTDVSACNYDADALCDDGTCIPSGCNDPSAFNYNPTVGCNDGSCLFTNECGNPVDLSEIGYGFNGYYDAANWEINLNDDTGNILITPDTLYLQGAFGLGQNINTTATITAVASGTVSFDWYWVSYDGSPYHDMSFYIVDGVTLELTTFGGGFGQSGSISFQVDEGETFGWETNNDDGEDFFSLLYIYNFTWPGDCIYGCTEPTACNYIANANVENGTCLFAPINDACSAAIEIFDGNSVTLDNTITCINGPDPNCGSVGIKDLWYSYTSVYGGNLNVSTILDGSLSDSRLAIYDACNGTQLACNDDAETPAASLDFQTTCGQTYYIQFGGFNAYTGTATLQVNESEVYSCSDPSACNFYYIVYPCAIDNCIYTESGCTDPTACNYDPNVGCDDGSCIGLPVDEVLNYCLYDYDADCIIPANLCDGYETFISGASFNAIVNTDRITEITLSMGINSCAGATMSVSINGEEIYSQFDNACNCLVPTIVTLSGAQLTGQISGDNTIEVSWDNEILLSSLILDVTTGVFSRGCTDPLAINYSDVFCGDDGSCLYFDDCGNVVNSEMQGLGFVNQFAESNWTIDIANGDGSVNISPNVLTVTGSDLNFLGNIMTKATLIAPATGSYSFDWNYTSSDYSPSHDRGYYYNGSLVQITTDFGINTNLVQNGSVNFTANEGDILGFGVGTTNDALGEAFLSITNFTYPVSCVFGCTDNSACNYDPSATHNDNTCTYPNAFYLDCNGICLNDADNDGVCDELEIDGCSDPLAINYNNNVTEENGSCLYGGCTDQSALNYNVDADYNNGTCIYPAGPNTCPEDIDGNGLINTGDLLQLLASFGTVCP